MRDSWYYAAPDGQIGPITLQELKDTLPNLPNAKDVYIWHDSLPDWIRAGDLAEIVANAKMMAPQDAGVSHGGSDQTHNSLNAAANGASWDPRSLEGFHPDPAYAIAAPDPEEEEAPVPVKRGRRRFGVVGVVVGLLMIVVGGGLFYLGVTGMVTWAANTFGFTSEYVDASPGAVLCVVGLVVIAGSRRKVSTD
jgi:uncharacterized protein DUF4339